jgi:hypothetical protein
MKHYKIESNFQADLKKEIATLFPGAVIMKNDPNDIQGIPDLTVIWRDHWAWLECKRETNAHRQSNQGFYIQYARHYSFGAFIYPENKEEVLDAMEKSFQARR